MHGAERTLPASHLTREEAFENGERGLRDQFANGSHNDTFYKECGTIPGGGVDSAYSVAALLNKKLIEEAGRLNVPGRPIQYKTTPDFLRTFGLSSLEELPPIEKITFGEPVELPEQPPTGEEA